VNYDGYVAKSYTMTKVVLIKVLSYFKLNNIFKEMIYIHKMQASQRKAEYLHKLQTTKTVLR